MEKTNQQRSIFAATITFILLLVAQICAADTQEVIIIGNDRGGLIGQRANSIQAIREAHSRVEIRGNVCYSACTMYLGAGDICITPQTTFGFHGPTRNGQALSPEEFDHWSTVMANHYPPALREWFMSTARHTLWSVIEIRGTDLLRYGFDTCA